MSNADGPAFCFDAGPGGRTAARGRDGAAVTVTRLPADIEVFARYLRELTARLDPGDGWFGVFRHRDPDSMRACLDGRQVPPWDVVEALLDDHARGRGEAATAGETALAARLHAASVAAHDRLPGGQAALLERLEPMLRERSYVAGRAAELAALLHAAPEGSAEAERLAHELAWARDDHARASARCVELRSRLAAVTGSVSRPAAPDGWFRAEPTEPAEPDEPEPNEPEPGAAPATDRPVQPRFRLRGARFGRLDADAGEAVTEPVTHLPPTAAGAPSGARFSGAPSAAGPRTAEPAASVPRPSAAPRGARFGSGPVTTVPVTPVHSPRDVAAVAETVAALGRLRADGRSGEAHMVLCEAAYRPAGQLLLFADELPRAGLDADWAGLLWEVAALPPGRLVAAVGTLAAAGRADDCARLMGQGVSRPAGEIAATVLGLGDAGWTVEARVLLGAFVRTRTPEDAALVALPDPPRLVPWLLDAARAVSPARERDVVRALRAAGAI